MSLPKVGLPAVELQRLFNDGRYQERMQAGEFRAEIACDQCSMTKLGGRETVMSEILHYIDKLGRVVAIIHHYRRHDGSTAASGMHDPKFLVHDGTAYFLKKSP